MQNHKVTQSSLLQFSTSFLNGYRFITFLTLIALSNGTCQSSIFKLYNDRYLPNHVVKTAAVTSQFECSMLCLSQEGCDSWNIYEIQSGLNCELNNGTVETALEESLLRRDGAKFGLRIGINTQEVSRDKPEAKISFVFTTLGVEGADGPTSTSDYHGTTLENQVTLQGGIQEWRVPHTGTYEIESRGASGANGTCSQAGSAGTWQRGGLGAKLSGKFSLTKGTLLKILVGQRGIRGTAFGDKPGGGGGGSFVTYANNTPLVIAGGGGGGGGCKVIVGVADGDPGQLGVSGSRCNSTAGNGGMLCSDEKGFTVNAGSGAGLLGGGVGNGPGTRAQSFENGGNGGTIHINSNGGFGGGGDGWLFGGGGGGYSGGGVWANPTNGVAGGGGSVNNGFDKHSGHGDGLDHGLVRVVLVP